MNLKRFNRLLVLCLGALLAQLAGRAFACIPLAPTVTVSSGATAFTEDQSAVVVDPNVAVSDLDSANLASATVKIVNSQDGAAESLACGSPGGLTVGFNSSTWTLSLSGTAAKSVYQTALRSVTYNNTSNTPNLTGRQIRFQVTDTSSLSSATGANSDKSVSVAAHNDAPVNTVPGAKSVNEDTTLTLNSMFSIADPDAGGASNFQFTLSASHGNLTLGATTGLTLQTGANDSHTMCYQGTLTNINAALAGVTYRGDNNYNGGDTITLGANDNGNTGAGGAQTDTDSVSVTINAVNDAPVNTVPGAQTVNEDTNLVLTSAFGIADVDAGSTGNMQFTLSATHGNLTLGSTTGLTLQTGANGSHSMCYQGTLASINTALSGVTYRGDLNYNGADTITLQSTDNGNTGSGGTLSDSDGVAVTVSAVNDAPALTVPGAQSVSEDTGLALPASSVSDVDVGGGSLLLTLSAPHGTLTFSSLTGLTGSGNGTASLNYSGALSAINTALGAANLSYRGSLNYNGADTITITVNDQGNTGAGGALSDSKTIAVTVSAVNDAPVNTVPGAKSVNEDTDLPLSSMFSIADVDAGGASNFQFTLSAGHDNLTLASTANLTLAAGANGSHSLSYTGTLANLNTALAGLTYRGDLNYNGGDMITLVANDNGNTGSGGAQTDSDNVAVTVSAVNDAPVNTVPGSQTVNEDTTLVLSSALSIADPDAGGASNFQFTLSASHGNLILVSTTGLTLQTGANGSHTMTYQGTLASVNAALAGVVYQGDSNYNGGDTITLQSTDNGNTGSGGTLSDSDSVAVTVVGVNDAPTALSLSAASVDENQSAGTVVGAFSTTDPDNPAAGQTFTYALVAGTGSADNASFAIDNPTGQLKTAASFDYETKASYAVRVRTTDSGSPALSFEQAFTITVNNVNEAPVVATPAPLAATEGANLSFGGFAISDPDVGGASNFQFTLSASHGNLTLNSTTGLTLQTGANGSHSMCYQGTLTSINNALASVTYRADSNWSAPEAVTLTANDNGNTGTGGPRQTSQAVSVLLAPLAPTGLAAQADDASDPTSAMSVRWQDNSQVESGFLLERSSNSSTGPWTTTLYVPAHSGTGLVTYRDANCIEGQPYWYQVRAYLTH